jgi:cysteine desulfurase
VDFVSFKGHKFGAPKGTGALFVREREGLRLRPFLRGGGQEAGRRAGTENILHIVGMGHAAEIAIRELEEVKDRYLALTKQLKENLMHSEDVAASTVLKRASRSSQTPYPYHSKVSMRAS